MKNIHRISERGGAALWVFVIVLVFAVFAGFRIGALYFDHETIKNEIGALGDNALTTDRNIYVEEAVSKLMRNYGVEVAPEKVKADINDDYTRIRIAFTYSKMADFVVYQHPFDFAVDVRRQSKKAGGMINEVQRSVEDSYGSGAARKWQKSIQEKTK